MWRLISVIERGLESTHDLAWSFPLPPQHGPGTRGGLASFHAAAGLAPDPAKTAEAVVQVYGARTMGVKGLFGVHTWIAVKPTDATSWTVYEIIGWRLRWSDTALVIRERQPDAPWFGSQAELYGEKRGEGVDEII